MRRREEVMKRAARRKITQIHEELRDRKRPEQIFHLVDALRRRGRDSEPLAVPEVGPDQNQVGSERRPEIAPRASNLPILAGGRVAWRRSSSARRRW